MECENDDTDVATGSYSHFWGRWLREIPGKNSNLETQKAAITETFAMM